MTNEDATKNVSGLKKKPTPTANRPEQSAADSRPWPFKFGEAVSLDEVTITFNKKKVFIWTGAVIGALVVIGLIVYLVLVARLVQDSGGTDFLGSLPLSGDKQRTISGLSGMACEHPSRRPIAVMLAADPINRPVSGFSQADMVWELPVLASNVTRLLAAYQCNEPTDIGSVRSARHDYLFIAEGMDAIIAHWGGSYHALNRIAAGEFKTINALTNPFKAYFRKTHLPAPYNGFTTYERLWNALEQLEYRVETEFEGYDFKDDVAVTARPAGGTLTIAWPGAFRVHYEYNPATNRYERFWAGVRQIDAADGEQVAPSAVIIMRATNGFADGPGGYNEVGIEGTGRLEVYQDGGVITGTWHKNELRKTDPVQFLDESGEEITFTRGQLWVMTPSDTIEVTWEELEAEPQLNPTGRAEPQ